MARLGVGLLTLIFSGIRASSISAKNILMRFLVWFFLCLVRRCLRSTFPAANRPKQSPLTGDDPRSTRMVLDSNDRHAHEQALYDHKISRQGRFGGNNGNLVSQLPQSKRMRSKNYTTCWQPADLISVSLDTDLHEDLSLLLAKHVSSRNFDWYFAVTPLEVDHDMGNLTALNTDPPLTPMLMIDRQGHVFGLPYGLKSAEDAVQDR